MTRNFFLLILLLCTLISNCRYYNYGVEKNNEFLLYHQKDSESEKKYEFISTLFLDDTYSKPFLIEIVHLSSRGGYLHSSIIIYDYYPEQEKKIKFNTILLNHYNNMKLIEAEEITFYSSSRYDKDNEEQHDFLPAEYIIQKGDLDHYIKYTKIYKLKDRPKKINEVVYLEFSIDGKEYILNYNLPIEYKLETTIWERLKFLFDTV